jgi:hypothetical protein
MFVTESPDSRRGALRPVLLAMLASASLCGPARAQDKYDGPRADETGKPFLIYGDTSDPRKFWPSGLMPSGDGIMVKMSVTDKPYSGNCCMRIIFKPKDAAEGWVGCAFLLENTWKPKDIFNMYKVLDARSGDPIALRFYARSAQGARVDFKFGGAEKDKGQSHTGYMRIGPEWELHEINLTDLDISSVHVPLAVFMDVEHNKDITDSTISVDLDRIYVTKLRKPKAQP